MTSIDIVLASRGRPKRLLEMVESAFKNAAHPEEVCVLCRVDDDDVMLETYRFAMAPFGDAVRLMIGECDWVPKLTEEVIAFSRADILCFAGDDVNFRTKGWDDLARAEMAKWPDGLGVLYTNDGMDRRKCQHFFVTRRWMEIVGCEGWRELRHFGIDQWNEEIAQRIGRLVYRDDIVLEHKHMKHRNPDGTPKGERDETYMSKRRENISGMDMETYRRLSHIRDGQTERVRSAIRECEARALHGSNAPR